jgi:4-amino-4-deoxy-L-arabinose transferase-like glycosyltransferase
VRYNGAVPRRTEWLLILILLAAAWARVYRVGDIPPGWRDDEIVETTVHAALVRQGHWLLFFPQAEGHEPLYHYLSAAWITALGQSLFSVRLLSAFLGLLSVAALYRLGRALFGRPAALLAAAALAVSFWALMYARFKLRQVGELAPLLLAFYFFWRALRTPGPDGWRPALLAALCLAVGVYTYYAARGGPLLLGAFAAYLLIFHRPLLRAHWRPLAVAAGAFVLLAAPLALAIARTPQGEARLAVVGAPLADLLRGNPSLVLQNTAVTLGMPFATGDPEFLYNIPGRPVFEPVGAALFAAGLLLSLWRWRQPAYAFLVMWLAVGLAPAFVSTPAASLGHTITAQPAVYLFPGVALAAFAQWARAQPRAARRWKALAAGAAGLFLLVTAGRDLRDYFMRWPALPEVRGLYRADLHEAAPALRRLPPHSVIGLASGALAPADALALALETPGLDLRPVVFNPGRAWPFPHTTQPVLLRQSVWPLGFSLPPLLASYALQPALLTVDYRPAVRLNVAFENNWLCQGYTLRLSEGRVQVDTYWEVSAGYVAPAPRRVEVLAGVPLPLKFFAHVLNPDGSVLAGDDRMDVDPARLRPGDTFIQTFQFAPPAEAPAGRYDLQIGLYDPKSGRRLHVMGGTDRVLLTRLSLPP